MQADRARWVLLAAAGVILIVHSLAFNFVTDDAYISFVFSRNFAEHGQLAFNLGQPVEGYTNFLWTFVLGLLMLLGISPEISSRVLGTLCALACLYVVFRVTERALGRKTPWAALPPLWLACSSGFACWTSGGLETQLFTLLVVIALDGRVAAAASPADSRERTAALRRMAIALALSAMTRPEGLLVTAVLGASLLVQSVIARPRRIMPARDELLAAAWFLGLWAPWFAWRWWYYGWPFPNTYYVKAHGPWQPATLAHQMYDVGLYYVWSWFRQSGALFAAPLIAWGLCVGPRRAVRFALTSTLAALAIVYLAYAVSVGGDFMGLHRFIMPVFVVAAIAAALGLEQLVGLLRGPYARHAAIAVAGAASFAFALMQLGVTRGALDPHNLANDHGIDTPAFLIVYTEDRAAIGRAMEPCFRADDFSIVGGAGAQPYYGRMRGIDVFGLVSEQIAHDEPRIRARAGHTKFAGDALLATYDPTFVFSCYELHATPAQPRLGCGGYWLAHGYEEVTMRVPGMRQSGEYYTFLAKRSRAFACPGRVP
jgi:hypothetical protein